MFDLSLVGKHEKNNIFIHYFREKKKKLKKTQTKDTKTPDH